MTAPWLDATELADLTGYKRQADQLAWLARNGFVAQADYFITAAGKPRLLRASLERRRAPAKADVLRVAGPKLEAVR